MQCQEPLYVLKASVMKGNIKASTLMVEEGINQINNLTIALMCFGLAYDAIKGNNKRK